MLFLVSCLLSSLVAIAASQSANKPVFAHYMIGEIFNEHTRQDIIDAKAIGLDAFALNIDQFQPWSESTVKYLFDNADELDFGLFFSFDMAPNHFSDPNQYADFLKDYISRKSHFKYNGKPLVSTFGGEEVTDEQWKSFKSTVGDVVVVPGFYQATPQDSFFDNRASIDGIFNWNSWPDASEGKVNVSIKDDGIYMSAARKANRLFVLGISPIQFKHMDSTSNNWYRRGEDNLEQRLLQALELQPDMLELQTWNDGGESHYMGRLWDEPMTNSPAIKAYVDGYDHTGYLQILPSFIQAWKRGDVDGANMVPTNGKAIQGTFWHHTLLVDGDCSTDPIGKSKDIQNAEDAVSGVILVAKGQKELVAIINGGSGSKELGKLNLKEGYNSFKVGGLVAGKVTVEVWEGSSMIGGGYSPKEVTGSADLCNYNFQVVGFPG